MGFATRRITRAVIPAAGVGARLLPATKSQPKEMLPVGRKPVIQHVVEEIVAAGITEILIVTSRQKRAIEDHFDGSRVGATGELDVTDAATDGAPEIRFYYTRQGEPRGLADAIAHAENFAAGEPFLVCLGDSIIQSGQPDRPVRRLVAAHEAGSAAGTILFESVAREDVSNYGIARPVGAVDSRFDLADLVEKPKVDEAPSQLAVAGRYVFEACVFDYIRKTLPGKGGELQISDSVRLMLADGLAISGVLLDADERRLDIGNFQSYFRAFFELARRDPELSEDFQAFALERLQRGRE